jgi:hypothetical protein
MDTFLYKELTASDKVIFAKAFQIALQIWGKDDCWCMKKSSNSIFKGFTTGKEKFLTYRGKDARPLMLSIAGYSSDPCKNVIVKRSTCKSPYCLNPSHYYWGTRADVAIENKMKGKKSLNKELIIKLRQEKTQGISSLQISKNYRMPYHTVRRICNNEIYESVESTTENKLIWQNVESICAKLILDYPEEAKNFNLKYYVTKELECPWHQKSTKPHKGNFGLMGECLDCMKEIKNGRATVDVRNFDFRWYWQVKSFWDKVDIKGDDECWPWRGPTKKNGSESVAYFPSPFHASNTQSAPRVAFWLSRGYTGKYRVFTKKTCKPFCCNPRHLTIKDLKDYDPPQKIQCIKLTHDDIIKHYKEREGNTQKE